MGKIHNVEKMTDNRFVNLYHVDATSVHNTPVSYYVASRAKDVPALKLKTGRNDPDGVIIYSIYGERRTKLFWYASIVTPWATTFMNFRQVWLSRARISMKVQSVRCTKKQVLNWSL